MKLIFNWNSKMVEIILKLKVNEIEMLKTLMA